MKIQILTNNTEGFPYQITRNGFYKTSCKSLVEAEAKAEELLNEGIFVPEVIKEYAL